MALQASTRWLHLLPEFDVSGRSRTVLELARRARMDGKHDEVLLYRRPWNDDADFSPGPVPMHFQPLEELGPKGGANRLGDLAVARGVQALVAHDAPGVLWGQRALGGRSEERLALLAHAAPPELPFLERRKLKRALARTRARYATTPALAEAWSQLGTDVEVLAPPIDLGRFHPDIEASKWRRHLLGDNELLIGSVQRAEPGKGQRQLVEAVELLRERGHKAALLLVGDGPDVEQHRAWMQHRDWLFVRKRMLEIGSFYTQLDVYALVGDDERAPLSLTEALACGRRCAVATSGGGAEDLRAYLGAAGAVVGSTRPAEVAAALEQALALAEGSDGPRARVAEQALPRQLARLEQAFAGTGV